jgi:hypothetical protein
MPTVNNQVSKSDMNALGGAMTFSAIGDTISTGLNTYTRAASTRAQAKYEKFRYDQNAKLAELQAIDALKRGERAASTIQMRTKQTIGSQRAALAAQGIEINADTAADIQADTKLYGDFDAIEVKNNAWREAFGYKMQALSFTQSGEMARSAGEFAANQTIAAGGMSAARGVATKAMNYYTVKESLK